MSASQGGRPDGESPACARTSVAPPQARERGAGGLWCSCGAQTRSGPSHTTEDVPAPSTRPLRTAASASSEPEDRTATRCSGTWALREDGEGEGEGVREGQEWRGASAR